MAPAGARRTLAAVAVTITRATSTEAARKWRVTMSATGPVSMRTAPMADWTTTVPMAATMGHRISGSRRSLLHATQAVARMRTVTTITASRCENSIRAWASSGGRTLPGKQPGH
jgi:hypothetical protein